MKTAGIILGTLFVAFLIYWFVLRPNDKANVTSNTSNTTITNNNSTGTISPQDAHNSSLPATQVIANLSMAEKEGLITRTADDSLIIDPRFLLTAPGSTLDEDFYVLCGEGNGYSPGVTTKGNDWLNGLRLEGKERWKLHKRADGKFTWYMGDIRLQLAFAQFKNGEGTERNINLFSPNVRWCQFETVKGVSWAYFNPQGGKGRVAYDQPDFKIKG